MLISNRLARKLKACQRHQNCHIPEPPAHDAPSRPKSRPNSGSAPSGR